MTSAPRRAKEGPMRRTRRATRAIRGLGLVTALGVLSACGAENPRLLNLRSTTPGPDEFLILPTKPLQAPGSYSELPPPTPGAPNRVDPTPEADAVAALGGNPAVLGRGADAGIVSYAGRFGVAPGIRRSLAAQDLAFRQRRDGRLLEQVFGVNVYFDAYRPLALDQYAELERFRRAGIRTPAAPPAP